MAESESDSGAYSTQFTEDFLTCSLCTELYDIVERVPKYLPCLHTFCKQCLSLHIGEAKTFLCPNCRKTVQLPPNGTIDSIPSNFTIENLKEYQAILDSKSGFKSLMCTTCKKGHKAIKFCHDCGQFQCPVCADAHALFQQFSTHTLSTIEQLQEQNINPALQRKEACSKHPTQDLTLFCSKRDCQMSVCTTCALLDHKESITGHKLQDLNTAKDEATKSLTSVMKQALKNFERKHKNISHLAENLEKIQQAGTKGQKQIDDMFDEFKHQLDDAHQTVSRNFQHSVDNCKSQLEEMIANAKYIELQINSVCDFAEQVKRLSSPSQLLGCYQTVIQQIRQVQGTEVPSPLKHSQEVDILSIAMFEESLDRLKSMPFSLSLCDAANLNHTQPRSRYEVYQPGIQKWSHNNLYRYVPETAPGLQPHPKSYKIETNNHDYTKLDIVSVDKDSGKQLDPKLINWSDVKVLTSVQGRDGSWGQVQSHDVIDGQIQIDDLQEGENKVSVFVIEGFYINGSPITIPIPVSKSDLLKDGKGEL